MVHGFSLYVESSINNYNDYRRSNEANIQGENKHVSGFYKNDLVFLFEKKYNIGKIDTIDFIDVIVQTSYKNNYTHSNNTQENSRDGNRDITYTNPQNGATDQKRPPYKPSSSLPLPPPLVKTVAYIVFKYWYNNKFTRFIKDELINNRIYDLSYFFSDGFVPLHEDKNIDCLCVSIDNSRFEVYTPPPSKHGNMVAPYSQANYNADNERSSGQSYYSNSSHSYHKNVSNSNNIAETGQYTKPPFYGEYRNSAGTKRSYYKENNYGSQDASSNYVGGIYRNPSSTHLSLLDQSRYKNDEIDELIVKHKHENYVEKDVYIKEIEELKNIVEKQKKIMDLMQDEIKGMRILLLPLISKT